MTEDEKLLLDRQLCFPLYAAARQITARYTPLLKPLGLTYTQYITLLVLWEQRQVTMGELCRRLRLDSGTLTAVVKRLAEQGLITRSRSQADERVVLVQLTPAGLALKEKAAAIPDQVGSCVPLTLEEALTLYQLLYKLMDGLKEGE